MLAFWNLLFGIWNLEFGIWNLLLGAWNFKKIGEKSNLCVIHKKVRLSIQALLWTIDYQLWTKYERTR